MKKNLTELVFILDRSGSMAGLEKDTIGGFNAMIEKQKAEEGEAFISTVLFDNYSEVIHDRVALSDVPKLTEREYYVRGCTALLDAVGGAIHHIGNVHKYAREEDRGNVCLALFCLLLFGHGIKAANGVLLQTSHGTTAIQDEYQLCQILLHSNYLL